MPTGQHSINKDEFRLDTLDDDVRVDELCRQLLRRFYDRLLKEGLSPADATRLANSADYYVRDFVVDRQRRNLFDERPGIVRQFAGNWYIISSLEPEIGQLASHLEGVLAFYRYIYREGLISEAFLREIERECADRDFYAGRIDSFWAISGDGYSLWERECPLKRL